MENISLHGFAIFGMNTLLKVSDENDVSKQYDHNMISQAVETSKLNHCTGRETSIGRTHYEMSTDSEFLNNQAISRALLSFQPICRGYFPANSRFSLSTIQCIDSFPNSETQIFHADNAAKGLTFVIPLTDITLENGPTQLISFKNRSILNPLPKIGDVLIFDARTLHRGLGNNSKHVRSILTIRYDNIETPPPSMSHLGATIRHYFGLFSFKFLSGRMGGPKQ